MKRLSIFLWLGLTAFVGVGCSDTGGASSPSDSAEIDVVNIAYAPERLEITSGTKVVWTNQDESVRHTVTSGLPAKDAVPGVTEGKAARPDGTFDGDLADASSEFTHTFEEPGTYAYFCEVHPSMTGEIVVR